MKKNRFDKLNNINEKNQNDDLYDQDQFEENSNQELNESGSEEFDNNSSYENNEDHNFYDEEDNNNTNNDEHNFYDDEEDDDDEIYDYGSSENEEKTASAIDKSFKYIITPIIFILLGLLAFFVWFFHDEEFVMFDAKGKTKVEVISMVKDKYDYDLSEANFNYKKTEDVEPNQVFNQYPKSNAKFNKSKSATEFVFDIAKDQDNGLEQAKAQEINVMKNFVGKKFNDVSNDLKKLNVSIKIKKISSSINDNGVIQNQSIDDGHHFKDDDELILEIGIYKKNPSLENELNSINLDEE